VALASGLYVYSWRPIPFNGKEWIEARVRGDDKLRQRMCKSLAAELSASKPTLEEVQLLLGRPDFHPVEAIYTYRVGRGAYTPFTGLFSIEIGEGNRVKRAFLIYD